METEINGMKLDNTLKTKTMNDMVKKIHQEVINVTADTLLKHSQVAKNQADIRATLTGIMQRWAEINQGQQKIVIDKTRMTNEALKIMNDVGINNRQMDVNEEIS